jgi:hypothetical protein
MSRNDQDRWVKWHPVKRKILLSGAVTVRQPVKELPGLHMLSAYMNRRRIPVPTESLRHAIADEQSST